MYSPLTIRFVPHRFYHCLGHNATLCVPNSCSVDNSTGNWICVPFYGVYIPLYLLQDNTVFVIIRHSIVASAHHLTG